MTDDTKGGDVHVAGLPGDARAGVTHPAANTSAHAELLRRLDDVVRIQASHLALWSEEEQIRIGVLLREAWAAIAQMAQDNLHDRAYLTSKEASVIERLREAEALVRKWRREHIDTSKAGWGNDNLITLGKSQAAAELDAALGTTGT